ncbi:GreA/GreB family elongation factor [Zunongwangia sp.]|uniref:GreA/GreB family elongation factor n=1 Tax=Zunongwangia sp. TaxID=1965325 RepID=UPI003AA91243
MKYGNLIIEENELYLFKQLISWAKNYKDQQYKISISKLLEQLKQADIREHSEMPSDVVRLNASVTIKTPFQVERTYQIVTPDKSDIKTNKISILAPMGLALLGYAEGDTILWEFPVGQKEIKIKKVKQLLSRIDTNIKSKAS